MTDQSENTLGDTAISFTTIYDCDNEPSAMFFLDLLHFLQNNFIINVIFDTWPAHLPVFKENSCMY